MTLIITHISKHGIIHACDTNVTYSDRDTRKVTDVKEHDKIFALPHLNAALTIAGSFSVGNVLMDKWMPVFIGTQSAKNVQTLEQFAQNLNYALQNEMTADEIAAPCLVQIAGYVQEDTLHHPEFWFVRNVWGIRNDGSYMDIRNEFQVTEDFWKRDYPNNNLAELFDRGGYQIYANGFPSGRIIYWNLLSTHSALLNRVWTNPQWQFRPPQTLEEMEKFVKLDMQYISELFKFSRYAAPYIGGTIKTILLPNPLSLQDKKD